METPTRVLGGVSVPDTPVIAHALEHVRSAFDPFLFNHAVRSWLFAMRIAQVPATLAQACLLGIVLGNIHCQLEACFFYSRRELKIFFKRHLF